MDDGGTRWIERHLGDRARAVLPAPVAEVAMFVLKQGWACLFGGLLLLALLVTDALWDPAWPVARYDALLVFALLTRAAFLRWRLETWAEARVILLFHLTGTAMELFKVSAGSWAYAEPALLKVMGVPLFSGFMCAAVGSSMARVIRIFDMRFAPYPPWWVTVLVALAIYANLFLHRWPPDARWALFALTVLVWGRTRVSLRVHARRFGRRRWMPMVAAGLLSAGALWVAEAVGTGTGTWLYGGRPEGGVSLAKLGPRYLLLWVAFVTVTVVDRRALQIRPRQRRTASVPPAATKP